MSVSVEQIKGKDITSIDTTIDSFENVVFVKNESKGISAFISTSPSLNDNDNVVISGLSTTSVADLNRTFNIGIDTARTIVYQEIPNSSTTGIVTDIYVTSIPSQISVGSSIGIGTEKLLVLNKFEQNKILRVRRGASSGVHTVGTLLELTPNIFALKNTTGLGFTDIDSKLNDEIFFNPHETIAVSYTHLTLPTNREV